MVGCSDEFNSFFLYGHSLQLFVGKNSGNLSNFFKTLFSYANIQASNFQSNQLVAICHTGGEWKLWMMT